ncbi:MAG TPA: hypothetical protein VGG75_14740 [Trebonia sp.]|jgi:hypothetical protein
MTPPITCFPRPAALRTAVLVIILTFVIILAALGYPPELALGIAASAAAIGGMTRASRAPVPPAR